jgi:hypothetical protein
VARRWKTAHFGIGSHVGSTLSQNSKGHVVGHVRDLDLPTNDPRMRAYWTIERQHFHADSCYIVGLLCLKTAKSGGLSSLVSSSTVHNLMAMRRPPRGSPGWQEAVVRLAGLQ